MEFPERKTVRLENVCVPILQNKVLERFRAVEAECRKLAINPEVVLYTRDLEGCFKVEFRKLSGSQLEKIVKALRRKDILCGGSTPLQIKDRRALTSTLWV